MHRAFEQLAIEQPPRFAWRMRLWRERCFLRVVWRHFSIRAAVMLIVLVGGALLFKYLGADRTVPFDKALWHTWMLIFGEPPGDYPASRVLDVMYFLMPIIGLTVIIEGIIDFALMLRDRKRYERSWCEMMASSLRDHIVLVGFGRLGFSSYLLLRRLGEKIVIIERDSGNQFLEELRRDGTPLILGDARREALLNDANLKDAKSIIVATNDDLANLEIALDARRIKPGIRVVLRMFDQNMATKVGDGFNIKLAMSQSAVSAPTFAMPAVDSTIIHSFVVGEELIVMQHWLAREGGPLCGRTIGDIMREYNVSVVKRRSETDGRMLFPVPEDEVNAGDHLLVQAPYDVLRKLREWAVVE